MFEQNMSNIANTQYIPAHLNLSNDCDMISFNKHVKYSDIFRKSLNKQYLEFFRSVWSGFLEIVPWILFLNRQLPVSAVFITKQKSLGWSKTSKRKSTFEFMESIDRKYQ